MIISKNERSRIMKSIKGQNTNTELIVRRLIHSLGYRYRLHRNDLPGKPDIVFPSRKKIIFVHGCFWHQHDCPRGARSPKTHQDYWLPKLEKNKQRDVSNQHRLQKLGWKTMVIWECELKDISKLEEKVTSFLG
ncbi:DNA mismatch endonuclease Vsr [Desulfohalovibrio reitneri]|uniref:very short patch repair endonuclease n=1 Tax=Desulfohalovibrio reitneri TaxID=1307759 RepID=UPI0009DF33CD